MKPLKYSAIMPKIALENLKLIKTEDMVGLIGKDLETIRCALQESAYHDEIATIPSDKLGTVAFEAALLQNYVKTLQALLQFTSGPIRNLLLAILQKIEVSNVKTMLRAVKSKMDVNEATKHIIPVGTMDKERYRAIIAGSKSIENAVNSLSNLEYGATLKEVWNECKENEDLLPLEVALDKAAYNAILNIIEELKGLDKKIAKSILGIEIDSVNAKIILKSKAKGLSKEQTKEYLMPTAFLDEETLVEVMGTTDVKAALERLFKAAENVNNPFYKDFFDQILKEREAPLSLLERRLDSFSLKMSAKMLNEYTRYYNIGFVLSFLNLKWFEIRNLRCIILGSERRTAINKVRELLVI